jgi:hypothetical protein
VHLGSLEQQKFASILFQTLLGSQRALVHSFVCSAGVHHIHFVKNRIQCGCRITTERRGKLEAEQHDNRMMNLHGFAS